MNATTPLPAPPFFTLTGNLLAERTLELPSWSPGETHRATAGSFQTGGKGINVSRMLTRLETPNTALCFPGGATGGECLAWMRAHGLSVRAFPNATPTRAGFVVRSPGRKETTFLGPDAPADAASLTACAQFLDTLAGGAVVAFCGSFPGWDSLEARPLRESLDRLIARATVCVDSYGPPLAWFVARPVALIKINRAEFDLLFLEPHQQRPVAARLAEMPARSPALRWIVTDGAREITFATRENPPLTLTPPAVAEVSATGSGDVLFACVLHALFVRGFSLADAVSFALPFASANAASPGIADFNMNQVPQSRSLSTP